MYIEFKLPSGAGGMAAHYHKNSLFKRLQAWAADHGTRLANSRTLQYKYRVELANPRDYTLLALTWTSTTEWDSYRTDNSDINSDPSIASSTATMLAQQRLQP